MEKRGLAQKVESIQLNRPLAHWISTKSRTIWANMSPVVCVRSSDILRRAAVFCARGFRQCLC